MAKGPMAPIGAGLFQQIYRAALMPSGGQAQVWGHRAACGFVKAQDQTLAVFGGFQG